MESKPHNEPTQPERREFCKKAVALGAGALATLVPAAAGVAVFLDPLSKSAGGSGFIKVGRLRDLPDEGIPRLFPVVATKTDVWNKIPEAKIGAVYLRRLGQKISALHVTCPHLGCAVEYRRPEAPPSPEGLAPSAPRKPEEPGYYFCPCHNSSFAVDGAIKDPTSPAKRPLDSLEVELRGEDIYVKFQNFVGDKEEKIPVS